MKKILANITLGFRTSTKIVRLVFLGSVLSITLFFAIRVAALPAETFRNPPEIRSANGVLQATLVAKPATFQINGKKVTSTVYNGSFIPPVLRVHPGETIQLRLKNNSSQPTNIHYHGFDVTPIPPSDNVFVKASQNGGTYDYRVPIPQAQQSGMYWYHPHFHTKAEVQVLGGLSGGLIVEGLQDKLPASFRGIKEQIMLFKDIPIKNGQIPPDFDSEQPTNRTLNGLINPTINIAPGETQLWRIANIGADIYYQLQLEGHTLHIVDIDGNPVNNVSAVRSLLVPPGKRYDVLVQGGKQGTYAFKTLQYNTGPDGDQYPTVTMATLRSQGSAQTPVAIPTTLPSQLLDLRQAEITRERTIVFSDAADGDTFLINGKLFDSRRIDASIPLGSTERWIIRNSSNEQHVFHIHQVGFQIVSVNGKPQDFDGYHDIVNVLQKGEVEVIIPFTNPVITGAEFVYHCHILAHEDKGMMAIAKVIAPNTASNPTLDVMEASYH